MFSSNLRLVPWKNKSEWENVYKDAYSSDPAHQYKACQVMELWLVMRNDVPPGVECTLNLLCAVLRDDDARADQRDLELMYSTAILRVINMLCDNARQSGKETIYAIANYYNIPDWIVNLRHDVAHGKSLPELSLLRRSAKFLLAWLREYYWEVEKDEMRDVILNRSRGEACKENINCYLEVYLGLMEFSKQGIKKIKNIPDEKLKYKLMDLNKFRAFDCAIECIPWIRHPRDNYAKEIPSEDVPKMKPRMLLKHLLFQIKDYLSRTFWGFDSIPLLVDSFNQHFIKNKSIVRETWQPLLQELNSWQVLDKVMLRFAEILNDGSDDFKLASSSWLQEISRAVYKGNLAQKLKQHLSSTNYSSFDVAEQSVLVKTMLRKRLSLGSDANDFAVYETIMKKIEKKFVTLKDAIRLTSPVDYITDNCSAMKVIEKIIVKPNQYTLSLLKDLFNLLKPNFSEKKREELNTLVMIYLGEKTLRKSGLNLKIKTFHDLDEIINESRTQELGNSNNSIVSKSSGDKIMNGNHEMDEKMDMSDDNLHTVQIKENGTANVFVRSNWDFSDCPLGISPWEQKGIKYYHKPFDKETCGRNYIFPLSVQQ